MTNLMQLLKDEAKLLFGVEEKINKIFIDIIIRDVNISYILLN